MKRLFNILILFILFTPSVIFAKNKIDSIDMQIYLNEHGDAHITEKWIVDGDDGTEWYKAMNGIDTERMTNFTVTMDGQNLTYKSWNIDESLAQKKGYYGINNTSAGIELCFGKYDYNTHTFVLSYDIKDYIINTSDSQILYWTMVGPLTDVDFKNFSVVISSYYEFPDNLDVWGYGYKGYAYVQEGKIYMSNEENTYMGDSYAVLLAKFPLETFTTTYTEEGYDSFETIYNMAEEGSYEYDYNLPKQSIFKRIINFILGYLFEIIFVIAAIFGVKKLVDSGYGYIDNKKVDKNTIKPYREIPCNKDIKYANTLLKLNGKNYQESNILGALILKWVKEKKIEFIPGDKDSNSSINLKLNPTFEDENEKKLFDIMYDASKDGILEKKEFEKWAKKNYSKFFSILGYFTNNKINELKNDGHIRKRINKEECSKQNVMDDILYKDSLELYGLKMFLDEFSSIEEKQTLEVHIWDEYLMFAYLFGIAEKVAKQLKKLYPEVIEQMDYDMNTVVFINSWSSSVSHVATSARSAAESYSGGGGGFSSGGGGGGSFGGGGGGSR